MSQTQAPFDQGLREQQSQAHHQPDPRSRHRRAHILTGRSGRTASPRPIQRLLLSLAVLLLIAAPAQAQEHRISGRVTAEVTGEPLGGVQVTVQGTSVSTVTDNDGRYVLTAPSSNGTLVFARIGFGQHEVPFAGQEVMNAQLTIQATELEGIVVVGYGEKSRVNLTESISTVSSEQINKVTVASPEQALEGRATGIQVTTMSGAPGAPTAVRIRGVGSIGNTQPLFVVDGVPMGRGTTEEAGFRTKNPLATLNPADIESISVLKDASAAAVYGVQAANGVVLITTKRGVLGKPTIRYDTYFGAQQWPKTYDMLGSQDWLGLVSDARRNLNEFSGQDLPTRNVDNSILQQNTNWQDVIRHDNAPVQSHNLSVSGATEQVSYFVSAGYFQQDAIQQKWDLERFSFRANSDFRINDRIRFGETFSLSNEFTLRGAHMGSRGLLLDQALRLPPVFRFRDPDCASGDGCPGNRYGYANNNDVLGTDVVNWPAFHLLEDNEERQTRVLGSLYAEVDLVPGLTFRSQGNINYGVSRMYRWMPGYTVQELGGGGDNNANADDRRTESYDIVWTNTATYDLTSEAGHSLNLLAGVETQQYRGNATSHFNETFWSTEDPIRRVIVNSNASPGGWAWESAFLGFLGRASYNYGDRYLLTASVRRDAASVFAPDKRWGTFPSVSAGWRVSNEPFFNVPGLSELKLRASWGRLGNSDIPGGAYPHLVTISPSTTYTLNGSDWEVVPVAGSRLANPDVTWETSTTTDVGFDATLLNNALDFSFTYYNRSTEDFLLDVDLPPSSGFERSPFNSGTVRNNGIELELGYQLPQFVNGLDLRIGGNLTTVRNELVALAPGLENYTPSFASDEVLAPFVNVYRTSVGLPVGHFHGYRTCGVYQTAEAAQNAPTDRVSGRQPAAGDMCFMDINGRDSEGRLTGQPDGFITADDREMLGSPIPDAYYGISLNATFRRFDLTAFFNGVQGVQKYNHLRRQLESMSSFNNNQLASTRNRWTPENPSNTMPRALEADPVQNNRFSDRWVEDASYFRLRTIQIGYTLPQGFAGTNNTRIYITGQNLFTLTGYSGLDPEFITTVDQWRNRNESALFQGTDTGDIPQPRIWQIGVSTSF